MGEVADAQPIVRDQRTQNGRELVQEGRGWNSASSARPMAARQSERSDPKCGVLAGRLEDSGGISHLRVSSHAKVGFYRDSHLLSNPCLATFCSLRRQSLRRRRGLGRRGFHLLACVEDPRNRHDEHE